MRHREDHVSHISSALADKRLAVVGATGVSGLILTLLLEERAQDLTLFGSVRSQGTRIGPRGVKEASAAAVAQGFDVVFFATPANVSRALAPEAAAAGAFVIDKSAAFRADPAVPLVVPEVNPEALAAKPRLVATPNCCVIPLACVLQPLQDAAGLKSVRVATYQSYSGAGREAMERLRHESHDGHTISFDWDFQGDESEEEVKIRTETRRVLGLPDLALSATCVRVPVMVGHALGVWLECEDELTPADANALLAGAPALRLVERPTTRLAAGRDEVYVGRVRRDPAAARGLALFIACDNLRKGAGLNAIQIAERLVAD